MLPEFFVTLSIMKIKNLILSAGALLLGVSAACADSDLRWKLGDGHSIVWDIDSRLPHEDHIEMAGKRVAVVLRYGVRADGSFSLNKSMVWPMLRTLPNNTHASLMRRYGWSVLDAVTVNGRAFTGEQVRRIRLDGVLQVESDFDWGWAGKCSLTRRYFPSTEQPALMESYTLINTGKRALVVEIPQTATDCMTNPRQGVEGAYRVELRTSNAGVFTLNPGEELHFGASVAGYLASQKSAALDVEQELALRRGQVEGWMSNLVLDTPDDVIDRMFAFSKIRSCESIYQTQGGPMHGPGGESYYAAIWANDQAEYVNPFFPYTGYDYGCASALNSFRHFARFMNEEWKPIPSSIVAEGLDIWNGAGDRGDAAMIAYGASRYALARGSRAEAEELWPLITWCLEYCRLKINEGGVVASDTDELENRFESGDANLCTSSLYYDALISAACLARELGHGAACARNYREQAATLRRQIERYFGADVEGYATYAYYKGNDVLRSWICIPLTMGIDERKEQTIAALFSPRLWTENGLLTQAGSETFWDRSTLYALRGVYTVGETGQATRFLKRYSRTRLLGEHVPYAIEAWPEGNQRHLSAESGLYARIITEGMLGMRPVGLRSFTLTPHVPQEWDFVSLKHIRAFGADFDLRVERLDNGKLKVLFTHEGKTREQTLREGETLNFKL